MCSATHLEGLPSERERNPRVSQQLLSTAAALQQQQQRHQRRHASWRLERRLTCASVFF